RPAVDARACPASVGISFHPHSWLLTLHRSAFVLVLAFWSALLSPCLFALPCPVFVLLLFLFLFLILLVFLSFHFPLSPGPGSQLRLRSRSEGGVGNRLARKGQVRGG